MTTETNQTSDSSTEETETVTQENNGTEENGSDEKSTEEQNQTQSDTENKSEPVTAPEKDPAKQALLADLHKERKERQGHQAKVTELETKVTELQQKADTVDAIQTKYDRLEEFLQKAGGSMGKALDSRSFTEALFESDKDIDTIVADWNKNNPSATTQALGVGPAQPAPKGPTMNDLLRSAAK